HTHAALSSTRTPTQLTREILTTIILASLVATRLCAAGRSPGHYLESPYTKSTLKFFEKSGCKLTTNMVGEEVYIAKEQENTVQIHLNKYREEDIPEHLVDGLAFAELTISDRFVFDPNKNPTTNLGVTEKILLALGTICAHTLVISGIRFEEVANLHNEQPSGWWAVYAWLFGCEPYLMVYTVTKQLELGNMSDISTRWFLARLDVSDCELNLHINIDFSTPNLWFLDDFKPKMLLGLYAWYLPNLSILDCAPLKRSQVLNDLVIGGNVEGFFCPSSETLQAIGSKQWIRMLMPLEVWGCIAPAVGKSFAADTLTITAKHFPSLVAMWETEHEYQEKASVKRLDLNLFEIDTTQTLEHCIKSILAWEERCFKNIEELKLSIHTRTKNTQILIKSQQVYIEEAIKVRRQDRNLNRKHTSNLPRDKNNLWIMPNGYHHWATGKIVVKIKNAAENGARTRTVLHVGIPSEHYTCLKCYITLDKVTEPLPSFDSCYVGLVSMDGHMICFSCYQAASGNGHEDVPGGRFYCPHCKTMVSVAGFGNLFVADSGSNKNTNGVNDALNAATTTSSLLHP
ncbi:hypothetical protein NEDG_01428, partial [Nematocida displodere]